jgi:hypothetical protein
MVVRADDPEVGATVDAIVGLVDSRLSGWTESQALAVDCALLGWTQEETGRSWQPQAISQQAVQKHLQRAGWSAVERALGRCRELIA